MPTKLGFYDHHRQDHHDLSWHEEFAQALIDMGIVDRSDQKLGQGAE